MACDISLGRKEACKENVGGLKAIYFINYDATLLSGATITSNEIASLTSSVDAYKYELKADGNTYEEANENSRENGTSFFTQTGTFVLKVQDAATQAELTLLSYGRPHVIIEDYNGNFRLAGAEHGVEVSVSTTSGGAMGDLNGYNLSFEGRERNMANFIDASLIGDASGFAVTEGS
tara:strand:+ start:182 stop:712 length:531 start_codon:yes stop_codon:yes gene_type:complete